MRRKQAQLYAALDLGTNACRLLIARRGRAGRLRIIESYAQIVRLGEGLAQTGCLAEAAMARALAALAECRARLARHKITHQRLVATAARREAANGAEFIGRVCRELGLKLEIIAPETEARLAVAGCGDLIAKAGPAVALFDIGGGSTEIVLLDMRRRRPDAADYPADHIVSFVSLPVGVVSLAEQFPAAEGAAGLARMQHHVEGLLAEFAGNNPFRALPPGAKLHLLGASGTVSMIAALALGLAGGDRRRLDGIKLENAAITAGLERLCAMSMAEKLVNPWIGSGRADLLLAGAAIMEAVRSLWPQAGLQVADRGLREGIIAELMQRQNVRSESCGIGRRGKIGLAQAILAGSGKVIRRKD